MYVLDTLTKKVAVELTSFHGFNSQSSSLYVQHILYNMLFLFLSYTDYD